MLNEFAMQNFDWSAAEKKIARKAFDSAVQAELHEFVLEFKAKASSVQEVESVWKIRDWVDKKQREIDAEYDYRYSQLIFVFARLVKSGKLNLANLSGLSDDKIQAIKHLSEI